MKQIVYFFLLSLLLVSCGGRSGYFKIDGRLLHINQGELYVYSPDGAIEGLDTIKIEGGRFTYEIPSQYNGTLIIVFPNFSTHAIFSEPGGSVEIKADASHLKEMEVKGTDDNELMTQFRQQVATASPPEQEKYAIQFVKDHPESPVSVFLTEKYLVAANGGSYKQAAELIALMLKEQPKNGSLNRLAMQITALQQGNKGKKMPKFTAKDVNGNMLTNANLLGKESYILTWSSWNEDSKDALNTLNTLYQKGYVKAISICLDPSYKEVKKYLTDNNITIPTICDGEMLESKLVKTLGLTSIPDNYKIVNGQITDRRVTSNTLRQRLIKLDL
ncbi:DUF4369 domain-containing protein [Prevotella disiens]|uniref:DUF4369 domain-containing protein n=2 Tax=Prevotella disiens TaxID=28130 RepID=A0A379DWK6_9BACT|nr:DUF4369 domain-containing protein [Prevotella disiens]RGL05317.1 DUF4369 domain-containing protein [Prevotella disiens]SUB84540.1 thiol-disulfide oxidoreductase [Prevotella disiens]